MDAPDAPDAVDAGGASDTSDAAPQQHTQLVGIVLIVCYMAADSFTSNWQSKIFKQCAPRPTPISTSPPTPAAPPDPSL